jgi:peptide/nickel transport system permease protein
MTRFLARRLATLAATLLVASVVIYGALYLTPGDPAALLAGGHTPSQATLAAIRAQYHLNDPFLEQYWLWFTGVLRWRLGQAIAFDDSVSNLIGTRLANTVFLVGYAAVLIIGAGITLGVAAALRGPVTRNAVTGVTSLLMAVPTFIAAVVLIWLFATKLNWFPVFGAGTGLVDQLRHMTLPAVALACSFIAYLSRVTRTAVTEQLRAEHVETARSRGLGTARIVRRHVLRNAAAPVLAVSGLTVAGLIAGTVVVEQAFGISGIGSLLVLAAQKQDFLVVQDISLLMVAAFVIINTIVDLISASLDPRLARVGAR